MSGAKQSKRVAAGTLALTLALVGVAWVSHEATKQSMMQDLNRVDDDGIDEDGGLDEIEVCSCEDNAEKFAALDSRLSELEGKVSGLEEESGAEDERLESVSVVTIDGPLKPTKKYLIPGKVIEFRGRTHYTLTFDIRIMSTSGKARGIFQVGDTNGMRSPGVFLLSDNKRRLGFRQISEEDTSSPGTQCNPSEADTPALKQWFSVSLVADSDSWVVKYDDRIVCSKSIDVLPPRGAQSVWFSTNQYNAANVYVRNLRFEVQ